MGLVDGRCALFRCIEEAVAIIRFREGAPILVYQRHAVVAKRGPKGRGASIKTLKSPTKPTEK
jgi:hypothetical protein